MKSYRSYLAASAFVLLTASPACAQTASTPEPMPTFISQQPVGEWRASLFSGQDVTYAAGEKAGDVSDLLFDKSGRITGVVIGVGGFLGLGEKHIAIPFDALTITTDANGERIVLVGLTKDVLDDAPEFKPTEKTTFMKAREKAGELIDQASKKIEEMRREE